MSLTNRDIIDKTGNKELAMRIRSLHEVPGFEYIDWEKWLKSNEPEFPYMGVMCKFKPYEESFAESEWFSGIVVDTKVIFGTEYKMIVSQGIVYKIPSSRVKILGE